MASTSTEKAALTIPKIGFRTALKALISIGLTAAVFYLVFSRADVPSLQSFLTGFRPQIILAIVALAAVATTLSVWRLKLIAQDLGYRLTMRDAIAAVSLGMLAGTVFFQIFGQLLARGALLSRRGMPVAATVTLTIYERAAAAGVSMLLAIAGGWYVFGRVTLDIEHGGLVFLKTVAGLSLALAAGAWLAWGPNALIVLRRIDANMLFPISRNILISTAIQFATMAAYVTAAHAVAPNVELVELAAAAAVVMLAAALPISLAGWGVRELSAVLTLGAVGVPSEAALMVAILIGFVSLLVIGAFAVSSLWASPNPIQIKSDRATAPIDYTRLLSWVVPLLAATAVFFQLYIPVGRGELNVNLADPMAIIGGGLFLTACFSAGRQWPAWRLSWFNSHILAITAVLALALLHGAMIFGWTPWALTNRFVGWFILLGYGATGALVASRGNPNAVTILLKTYAAVACSIVVLELFLTLLAMNGVAVPHSVLYLRIAGFAQNPNAFAFQVLLALSAAIAADFRPRIAVLTTTICLLGIWFTASRAVFIAVPFIIGVAMFFHLLPLRRLLISVVLAGCVIVMMATAPSIVSISIGVYINGKVLSVWAALEAHHLMLVVSHYITGFPDPVPPGPPAPSIIWPEIAAPAPRYNVGSGTETSDNERVVSLKGALAIFLNYPIFGGGLGRFVADRLRASESMLVIHSTPLWLLAETGIVGVGVVASLMGRVLFSEFRRASRGDHIGAMLVLILLSIGIVSLVHELFYQRGFWLLFGAGMALLPGMLRQDETPPAQSG